MGILDAPGYSRTNADTRFKRKGMIGQERRDLLPRALPAPEVDATGATIAVAGPYSSRVSNISNVTYLPWATLVAGGYINFIGGTAGSNGGSAANVSQAGSPTPTFGPWVWEFIHGPGTVIELFFIRAPISSTNFIRVLVNDKYVSTAATPVNGAAADNKLVRVTLTFPTAGARKVALELSGGCQLVGINLDADTGSTITPTPARPDKVAFLTDSWGDSPLSENASMLAWPWHVARMMRWGNPWVFAQGGTGYLNVASGTKKKFRDRLSDVAAISPSTLVVLGGYNDSDQAAGGSFTASAITAEVTAFVNAIPTSCPTVDRVFIIGAQQPVTPVNGNLATVTSAIQAGVAAASVTIPVTFIDMSGWITGATSAPIAVPRQLAATSLTTGGTFAGGTYYAVVTAVDAYGETTASNEISAVTTGTTSSVIWEWAPVGGATSYNLYIGTAAGTYTRKVTGITTNKYTDASTGGTTGTFTTPGSNGTARNPATTGSARVYTLPDWTHLTDKGHEYIAHRIAVAMQAVLP